MVGPEPSSQRTGLTVAKPSNFGRSGCPPVLQPFKSWPAGRRPQSADRKPCFFATLCRLLHVRPSILEQHTPKR